MIAGVFIFSAHVYEINWSVIQTIIPHLCLRIFYVLLIITESQSQTNNEYIQNLRQESSAFCAIELNCCQKRHQ